MPDWVSVNVQLSGSHAALAAYHTQVSDVPEASGIFGITSPMPAALQNDGTADWYTWAKTHWGTKWDVPCNEVMGLDDWMAGEPVLLRFSTANSPPCAWATALTAAVPGLVVRMAYCEQGKDLFGFAVAAEGRCIMQDDKQREDVMRDDLEVDGEHTSDGPMLNHLMEQADAIPADEALTM